MNAGPGYWMHETTGALRPAVEALLLETGPLNEAHIAALRAYLRQWIMAPCWHGNGIAKLQARLDGLTSREAIQRWLADAADLGIDPL